MFCARCFKCFAAAPICSSFSIAVTPPVRCAQYPRGIPGMRPSMRACVAEGNSHDDYVKELVEVAEEEEEEVKKI